MTEPKPRCPSRIAAESGVILQCARAHLVDRDGFRIHGAGDVEWLDGDERVIGGSEPDDLDRFTAEQMQDAAFVRAWAAAQTREVQAAHRRGFEKGQRQATEGWSREWGVYLEPDDLWPYTNVDDEADARHLAGQAAGRRVVSRVVGPWEGAEDDGS